MAQSSRQQPRAHQPSNNNVFANAATAFEITTANYLKSMAGIVENVQTQAREETSSTYNEEFCATLEDRFEARDSHVDCEKKLRHLQAEVNTLEQTSAEQRRRIDSLEEQLSSRGKRNATGDLPCPTKRARIESPSETVANERILGISGQSSLGHPREGRTLFQSLSQGPEVLTSGGRNSGKASEGLSPFATNLPQRDSFASRPLQPRMQQRAPSEDLDEIEDDISETCRFEGLEPWYYEMDEYPQTTRGPVSSPTTNGPDSYPTTYAAPNSYPRTTYAPAPRTAEDAVCSVRRDPQRTFQSITSSPSGEQSSTGPKILPVAVLVPPDMATAEWTWKSASELPERTRLSLHTKFYGALNDEKKRKRWLTYTVSEQDCILTYVIGRGGNHSIWEPEHRACKVCRKNSVLS
ncbi:hypothetical protein K491DRAFT_747115 [Lophiostoma macrostomum CBS 122681]|uniref:Uncharacterized protein n=1 Tax=Lophiostoma macrostomum CBS 122681 TaxID=1314788 RepID=A0A6A6T5W6_9PLEO|nr:hypothetical protein K491DRAFT_747115 [Lophiostoma macrostomum CBS 122681]